MADEATPLPPTLPPTPTPTDAAKTLIASPEYAAVKAGLQQIASDFLSQPAATYPFQSLGPLERMIARLP